MVVRQKTIEYAFPTNTVSVATATRLDFPEITLYIPEVTNRVFRSVIVEVYAQDDVTVAATITANLVGIKLGAVAFSDFANTISYTNSGEQCAWMFQIDATSYFDANFGAGASQTCQVGMMITGSSTVNQCARLIITYDYEEQDTQVKTVRIPLESNVGSLTTSLVEIGTDQIPALDTFLPEASKTYRYIWFEIEGNDGTVGTVDYTHGVALDAEARTPSGTIEAGLNSARWFRRIWVRNDMTTNAVHKFLMDTTSAAGGTFDHLAIVLCVTYEYSSVSSTTILNSIRLPLRVNAASTSGSSSADKDLATIDFYIEEPATISLVQSGIVFQWQQDTASNLAIMCGSQTARSYVDLSKAYCGGMSCSHRIDSGSASGEGITLARGKNTLTIYAYSNQSNVRHNALNGIVYLNYTSSKSGTYGGTHNHTVIYCGHTKNSNAYLVQTQAIAPVIPETAYYCSNIAWTAVLNKISTTTALGAVAMSVEWNSGEKYSEGTADIGALFGWSDAEAGICMFAKTVIDYFERYPGDTVSPNDRMPLEVSRNWFLACSKQPTSSMLYITYHSITYTIAGTIHGTGGGTVSWKVHQVNTGDIIGAGTGTSPSITWYDNTIQCYIEAYEDAAHAGRSANGVAV